jgi:ketosteroid isomerase-like protein
MNDMDHVLATAAAVMRAIESRDRSALAMLLSPEFTLRMPGAADVDRQGFIDAIAAIPGEITSIHGHNVQAIWVGDTAVVTGIQVAVVRLDSGAEVESRTAFTDLFRQSGDAWQLVFASSVDLPLAGSEG